MSDEDFELVHGSGNVFRWEHWLQVERSASTLNRADTDLEAEPILISAVSVLYMSGNLAISWFANSLLIPSVLVLLLLGAFIYAKYRSFRRVLQRSTAVIIQPAGYRTRPRQGS